MKNIRIHSATRLGIYVTAILLGILSFKTLANSYDHDPTVEPWMTTPLEAIPEEEPEVEDWMKAPFETSFDEELYLEDWMTSAWI